ncbi:hypothetical protein F2Q69_00006207 [Brassica cretica]|uniref:Uncharacterized protein n=1 Tax=Brassica cretica TaxID=69181 RepID=A0A8S9NTQ6_BRACR|nr:hypothetical protein F2Q69_00006207 [Brassica cretica]
MDLMQNVEALCSIRNHCLDLSKKGPPRNTSHDRIIYQSYGNSEIVNHAKGRNQSKSSATKSFNICSFGARLIQSTNLRVILQFRAYQVVSEPLNRCQRRLFSQFEVLEFCDNLVEGVVKVLKDVSKIQKKSRTTRAPVAKPSLFINKKPKGKSENNIEDLKDFSDSLPIFDKYDEELMESWITCEDECDLPSPKLDLMFDIDNEETNGLTCFEPEHPSSLVIVSQVFEEEPLDYPHQEPRLDTRRPLDDGLGPIFDEEDELGPTFDEKAPSMTSINIENHLCFDPSTTPTPLSKEHCKELCIISYVPDLFDKVSSNDIKRSSLDHVEKSFELDLQQLVFYSRKSFDSFVFKENSFSLRSYGHELITGILFPSSYDLDDFMVSTSLEQNSHKAETDFCGDSVLKPTHSYSESDLELKLLCSESDQVRHVLKMIYGTSCLENILIYNTFFDKHVEPWIRNSQFELNLLCSKSEKLAHDKHDQSPRGLRNRSIDRAYKFKIWRWKNPSFVGLVRHIKQQLKSGRIKNDVPLGSAPGKTYMHGLIIESKRLEEESDQTEFICDSYAIYKSGRIKNDVPLGSAPGKTYMHGLIIETKRLEEESDQTEFICDSYAIYKSGRIKWYQSHSEVHSSSQPAILNSSDFRRSTMSFGLLINHEEKAARKAQEEKLREWSKEETPSTRTKEKTNKGLERWLGSFKVKIHQRITNSRPSPVLEEDQEAKDIEPDLSTVYVRVESMDDQMYQEEDLSPVFDEEKDLGPIFDEEENLGPIFDEEEELEAVSVLMAVQKVVEDVVDSGPEADHEKDLTTPYALGDILGSFSCDKLVQTFVWKEYDPVKLLRHEEERGGLMLNKKSVFGFVQEMPTKKYKP